MKKSIQKFTRSLERKISTLWLVIVFFIIAHMGNLSTNLFSVGIFKPIKLTGEYALSNTNDSNIANITAIIFNSGGNALYGFYLSHHTKNKKTNPPSQPVVVYFHGNRGNIDSYANRVKLLYHSGVNVFVFDYAGYGKSEGTPSVHALQQNATDAMLYLTHSLHVPTKDVSLYGYSLGSVPAVYIASLPAYLTQIKALMLEAPIGNFNEAEQKIMIASRSNVKKVIYQIQVLNELNISNIKKVRSPLLLLHGKKDLVLSYQTHGMRLYEAHRYTKYKIILENGTHYNLPFRMGLKKYFDIISTITRGKKIEPSRL